VAKAGPTTKVSRDPEQRTPTIDGLFRRILARKPDALALPIRSTSSASRANRQKRLTFAKPTARSRRLSAHFIERGCRTSVIAVQCRNTVEFMLTVLAAHRAGLVVALLPLLWRRRTNGSAQSHRRPAIVTTARSTASAMRPAMNAAADAFFDPPCLRARAMTCPKAWHRSTLPCQKNSATTRAVTQDGRRAAMIYSRDGGWLSRRTAYASKLIAGGLALSLESDVPQGSYCECRHSARHRSQA